MSVKGTDASPRLVTTPSATGIGFASSDNIMTAVISFSKHVDGLTEHRFDGRVDVVKDNTLFVGEL